MAPTMTTLNQIKILNQSGLNATQYTVWVAGFMQDADNGSNFHILQADGQFAETSGASSAAFINASNGLTLDVPAISNSGNNRLVFTVTKADLPPKDYPVTGYTAYPFPAQPGVSPAGPYDIFEFGPNAQYDVSAVDAFGINLSFTVTGDDNTYGVLPSVSRQQVGTAFARFTRNDPYGKGFAQLLYTSPPFTGYPQQIEDQFAAIVSPKDWLAIHPDAEGLQDYWSSTVDAFFTSGNQISFYLNGATVGTYAGSSDGSQYTLAGPDNLSISIPKADFAGNQPFIQAVRTQKTTETDIAYAAFGQIEAAIFQAFSRGVALDGVVKAGASISASHSSDAWTNIGNWYSDHANRYNGQPSVYDVYARFFHCAGTDGSVGGDTVFGKNAGGSFAMAYGFSLDENPNVGSTALKIPPGAWPGGDNTPSKTPGNVGSGQTVTITVGPWK